jgi:nucleoside-diphosphate-sugar epimerase
MGREVLVTGATGFIGRAATAALAEAGFGVRAGVNRAPLPAALAALPGVTPTPCPLDDAAALAAALAGADAVVHAAYGWGRDSAAQERALLEAAARAGVSRLVHLSSIAVYGVREGEADEEADPVPPLGPYERAKRGSEAAIAAWCAETGGAAALLRAGAVWGPGSALWVEGMLRRLRSGGWRDFGALSEGLAPLVHVRDVAAAAAAAVAADLAPGTARAFNLVHPERVSWNAYVAALAAAMGAPAPRPIGPAGLAARRALAAPAKALRRLGLPAPASLTDFPAARELAMYGRRTAYPVDRAARELGWTPRVALADGLGALRAGAA